MIAYWFNNEATDDEIINEIVKIKLERLRCDDDTAYKKAEEEYFNAIKS